MPRIDDYKQALALGKKDLADKNPDLLASSSGAVIGRDKQGNTSLSLDFLKREINISWPELAFSQKGSDKELPSIIFTERGLRAERRSRGNGSLFRRCLMGNFIWMPFTGGQKIQWSKPLETALNFF